MQGIAVTASIVAVFALLIVALLRGEVKRWRHFYDEAMERLEETGIELVAEKERGRLKEKHLRADIEALKKERDELARRLNGPHLEPEQHAPAKSREERMGPPSTFVRSGDPAPTMSRPADTRRDDTPPADIVTPVLVATMIASSVQSAPACAPAPAPAPESSYTSSSYGGDSGSSSSYGGDGGGSY